MSGCHITRLVDCGTLSALPDTYSIGHIGQHVWECDHNDCTLSVGGCLGRPYQISGQAIQKAGNTTLLRRQRIASLEQHMATCCRPGSLYSSSATACAASSICASSFWPAACASRYRLATPLPPRPLSSELHPRHAMPTRCAVCVPPRNPILHSAILATFALD